MFRDVVHQRLTGPQRQPGQHRSWSTTPAAAGHRLVRHRRHGRGDRPRVRTAGPGDDTLERALVTVLPSKAFSLVLMDRNRVIGVRDPRGFRPLCLGKLDSGWVLASETPALDVVGAHFVRELDPGEMVVIDAAGVRSVRPFEDSSIDPKLCLFEFVYFARPDSQLYDRNVHQARVRMGEQLADQAPVDADMVMGVPESGIPAAEGYARRSGIPFGQGLVKNRYIGRTFIAPSQEMRALGVRMKLNPLRDNIEGDGWSSSTTRSCRARPPRRWWRCCWAGARGAPACRRRRTAGRASSAWTPAPGDCWPPTSGRRDPPLPQRRHPRLPDPRPVDRRHRRSGAGFCGVPDRRLPVEIPVEIGGVLDGAAPVAREGCRMGSVLPDAGVLPRSTPVARRDRVRPGRRDGHRWVRPTPEQGCRSTPVRAVDRIRSHVGSTRRPGCSAASAGWGPLRLRPRAT